VSTRHLLHRGGAWLVGSHPHFTTALPAACRFAAFTAKLPCDGPASALASTVTPATLATKEGWVACLRLYKSLLTAKGACAGASNHARHPRPPAPIHAPPLPAFRRSAGIPSSPAGAGAGGKSAATPLPASALPPPPAGRMTIGGSKAVVEEARSGMKPAFSSPEASVLKRYNIGTPAAATAGGGGATKLDFDGTAAAAAAAAARVVSPSSVVPGLSYAAAAAGGSHASGAASGGGAALFSPSGAEAFFSPRAGAVETPAHPLLPGATPMGKGRGAGAAPGTASAALPPTGRLTISTFGSPLGKTAGPGGPGGAAGGLSTIQRVGATLHSLVDSMTVDPVKEKLSEELTVARVRLGQCEKALHDATLWRQAQMTVSARSDAGAGRRGGLWGLGLPWLLQLRFRWGFGPGPGFTWRIHPCQ
jgi:hypothetical protein